MSHQRKSIGSPCSACGVPVETEAVAVRTLTRTLPYTPKIWHRPCFEALRTPAAENPPSANVARACSARVVAVA